MTNKDYDRLTFQPSRHSGIICGIGLKANSEEIAERLYALEEMIENGTLVFLPFKCGDKMWHVWKTNAGTCHVEEMKLWEITITDKEIFYDTLHHGIFESTDNLYHTKEEAEKVLEEMKK